jgi:hypothetical protein
VRLLERLAGLAAAGLLALSAAGCAASIGAVQPSFSAVEAVHQVDVPVMSVGTFAPGPKVEDRSITVRAINVLKAPGGSFSGYLKSTLEADLKAGGKLDPGAPIVLQGVLTRSDLSSAIGTGTAVLGAHFTLLRDGKSVFEKDLSVNASWDSSFLGAVAIPDAINQYTALYEKLSVALLTDADFKAAVGAH